MTMNDDFIAAATVLAERLMLLAKRDDDVNVALRRLAEAILTSTERPSATQTAEPEIQPGADGAARSDPAPARLAVAAEPARPAQPLRELTLGRVRPVKDQPGPEPLPLASTGGTATTDADLPALEARCRLKAEGIRWAATRQRLQDDGADFQFEIAPRDREILDRARGLDDCYLWMNTPNFVVPRDSTPLEDAAGWFEAVADGLALIREMLPDAEANRAHLEPALDLLAEAQSALRVAIERIDGPNDQDQYRAYDWLRGTTNREQIYIHRHMRLDDPADPALLSDWERRLEKLDEKIQRIRGGAKKRKSAFNRLRYHAKRIGQGTGDDHDWRKVVASVDELIGERVAPSSVEIREILLPILDDPPDLDDAPPSFGLVLREIDRYLANRAPAAESATAEIPTAEVAEVARLLAGKSVLLIGGVRRPGAHDALRTSLGLEELIWPETREHESIERFRPIIARPEVVLVLLAIRWSSHSFSEVKQFCERHGKPMVRLPGGYGVNQVAAQILAQCGEQLGAGGVP